MSEASGSGDAAQPPKKKRTRLSCACVRCRAKKIRCDEALPRCGPCKAANAECVVTRPSDKSHVAPIRQKTGLVKATVPIPSVSMLATSSTSGNNNFTEADRASFLNQMQFAHAQANASQLPRPSPMEYSQPQRVTFAPSPSQHTASPGTSRGAGLTPDTNNNSETSPASRLTDLGIMHDVDPVKRKFVGASSSQIFLKWLDSESKGTPLTPYLRHGVSSSDEFDYNVDDSLKVPMPPPNDLKQYLDRFFQTCHVMHPVVDEAEVRAMAADPALLDKDPISRVVLYLVICIGNDVGMTPEINFSQDGSRYLEAAWPFLPLVTARPFKSSVQALCLFSIALRNRNKDGNAYLHIGTAIRVAQSLGLHLGQPSETPDLDARIFWTCYNLDKTLAFETGRPGAINDVDCSTPLPNLTPDALLHRPSYPVLNPFMALIGICQELSLISARLFSKMATTMTPVEVLQWIGECDTRLVRWAESLPLDLQPGIDGAADSGILPFTARLACPYYLALITLHRLSLFDEATLITPYLADPSLKPYLARLRSSGSICAQAARATLTTFERLANRFPADKMWTVHAVTSAIFVLALRIWKNPTSMSSRADLQFIRSASEFAVEKYREFRYNEAFVALLPKLLAKIQYKVDNPSLPSRPTSRQPSPESGANGQSTTTSGNNEGAGGPTVVNGADTYSGESSITQNYMGIPSVGTSAGAGAGPDFAMWSLLLGDGDSNQFDTFFNSMTNGQGPSGGMRNGDAEAGPSSSAFTPGAGTPFNF